MPLTLLPQIFIRSKVRRDLSNFLCCPHCPIFYPQLKTHGPDVTRVCWIMNSKNITLLVWNATVINIHITTISQESTNKFHSFPTQLLVEALDVNLTYMLNSWFVCRNSYGLAKTEICINTLLSSLLDT